MRIDKDSIAELFVVTVALATLQTTNNHNLYAIHTWLQDCYPAIIELQYFNDDMLETQCEAFSSEKEVSGIGKAIIHKTNLRYGKVTYLNLVYHLIKYTPGSN